MQNKMGMPNYSRGFDREFTSVLGGLEQFTGRRKGRHPSPWLVQDLAEERAWEAQLQRDLAEDDRLCQIEEAQRKARIPADDVTYEGLAAVYGVVIDAFGIRFQPGCFKAARPSDVCYWWEHNDGPSGNIGETATITALYEITRKELPVLTQLDHPDATGGLVVVRRYLDHDNGRAARAWIKSGGVVGLSVGYNDRKTRSRMEAGRTITDIYEAELVEISDTRKGGACPGVVPVIGTKHYSFLQGQYKRRSS